jgi:hypothetical protein
MVVRLNPVFDCCCSAAHAGTNREPHRAWSRRLIAYPFRVPNMRAEMVCPSPPKAPNRSTNCTKTATVGANWGSWMMTGGATHLSQRPTPCALQHRRKART